MQRDQIETPGSAQPLEAAPRPLSFEALREWIVRHLAARADAPAELNPAERFQEHGLDSLGATTMLRELGKLLGRRLSPTLAWGYPTPDALARHLAVGEVSTAAAAKSAAPARDADEPMAIVGIACRFPGGATSPEAYWAMLRDGVDAVTEVPAGRWKLEPLAADDPDAAKKKGARSGAFLEQVDQFDAPFFAVSPREAVQMDPQQRLLLELSWEALEDAGIPPATLRGRPVSVFMGVIWHDYADLHMALRSPFDSHTGTGQSSSIVANRISYAFGLNGPSVAIDTACSSSLVAVHLACQSLRAGESELALVGGVNLLLSPRTSQMLIEFGGLSPSGHCHAFGDGADGFVRGEGGGIVVLKPLSRALADGDRVYCVVRGSAANSDGASNGLTAPNPAAQRAVLEQACARAGVEPSAVHYVEAHGTGTRLGDPIEAEALGAVLGRGRDTAAPLLVGSVKTNIGHLEGASGIAGLIKAALAIAHRCIPPSLHCERPNPLIPFAELHLRVNTQLTPWPTAGTPLAGISSFGWGGTNCHVLLGGLDLAPVHLLMVAADDEPSLAARAAALVAAVTGGTQTLVELCAEPHGSGPYRLAVRARTAEELAARITAWRAGGVVRGVRAGRARAGQRKVAFVFSPQGGQWRGMATELLRQSPVFARKLRECDAAIQRHAGYSLLAELHATDARVVGVDVIQPALFAVQVALATVLQACGIRPDVVVGHSLGEIAAAHVSGAIPLDDAVYLVVHYSRLQVTTTGNGGMALVGLPADQAEQLAAALGTVVCVAGHNGPTTTVLSGPPAELDQILAAAAQRGVFGARIESDVAGHGPQIDPIMDALRAQLAPLRPRPCELPMWGTSRVGRVEGQELDGDWFAHNLRAPVLFYEAVTALVAAGTDVFVEVNPHPILLRALRQGLEVLGSEAAILGTGVRGEPESEALLDALGRLWIEGVDLHAERDATAVASETPALVTLSARTEAALAAAAGKLHDHLEQHPELALPDIAFSLANTRSALEHRLAIAASSRAALQAQLASAARGQTPAGVGLGTIAATRGKLTFLFTGQGGRGPGVGRELYEVFPVFQRSLEEAWGSLDPWLARPLREVMFAPAGTPESALLEQTEYMQPALFALQWALAALWRSWGVQPDWLIGHSLGELSAACVAGVFTLAEGARLVAARARLMQALPTGGVMVAIAASAAEVHTALTPDAPGVALAAINGPQSVVISGEEAAVLAVAASFSKRGVRTHRLTVSHAFHSARMEPMLQAFAEVAQSVTYKAPTLALVSNVSGARAGAEVATAEYWVRHVRETVRFAEGVQAAQAAGCDTFVELGPTATLVGLVEAVGTGPEPLRVASLRSGQPEPEAIVQALGKLWSHGDPVELSGLFPVGGRRLALPTYPFQRQRHWLAAASRGMDVAAAGLSAIEHPLLGACTRLAERDEYLFTSRLSAAEHPWLADHVLHHVIVVPGTTFLDLALTAGLRVGAPLLQSMTFESPLRLLGTGAVRLQLAIQPADALGQRVFTIHTCDPEAGDDAPWVRHVSGVLAPAQPAAPVTLSATVWPPADAIAVPQSGLYERLARRGAHYGPAFCGIQELYQRGEQLYARVVLPAGLSPVGFTLHPALLDACLQVAIAAADDAPLRVPFEFAQVRLAAVGAREVRVEVRLHHVGTEQQSAQLRLCDPAGQLLAEIDELIMRSVSPQSLQQVAPGGGGELYAVQWLAQPAPAERPVAGVWAVVGTDPLAQTVTTELARAGLPVQHWPEYAQLIAAVPESAMAGLVRIADSRVPDSAAAVQEACAGLLAELQDFTSQAPLTGCRYVLLTQRAVAAQAGEAVAGLAQAALWGLVRTARSEHPEHPFLLLDLDAAPASYAQLVAALADKKQPEAALRQGVRLVPRLVRVASGSDSPLPTPLSAAGTVLVTGGTSGLGAEVARHLATQHGIKHLLLTSRQGAATSGVEVLTEQLEALGCTVRIAACDVADRAQLQAVLGTIGAAHPLTGVFHCAAVLDDGVLAGLRPERLQRVLAPKVDGALNLHALTRDQPLSAFVMFSSVVGLLGGSGQGSYAAANALLDALCAARKAQGLPGTSLAWGSWAKVGLAARLGPSHKERLRQQGFVALEPEQGLQLMDRALQRPEALLAAVHLELTTLQRQSERGRGLSPLLGSLLRTVAPRLQTVAEAVGGGSLLQKLAARPAAERERAVLDLVCNEVAAVVHLPSAAALRPEQSLKELGLDSLMAVELRNRLGALLATSLPATMIFDYPTPEKLASHLCSRCFPDPPDSPASDSLMTLDLTETEQFLEFRQALEHIPLAEFGKAGILQPLLQLAAQYRSEVTARGSERERLATIDDDALIAMALGGAGN